MHSILIVTSRNVVTPGGEFSLIKNRARALEASWGFSSEIISLCNTALNVADGDEAFGEGTYIRRNFMNPVALLSGYEALIKEAENTLQKKKYQAVLLSGAGMLRYIDRIKRCVSSETLVCADVHGYFGDGKLLARDESFVMGAFHTLAAVVEEHEQKQYLKRFDRIFVVSAAYRDFLCEVACCRPSQFYIVPCATGEIPSFTEKESAEYRHLYRAKYHLADDEMLLVYSGGASSWQCLPETVELYRALKEKRRVRLLILSGDKEGILAAIEGADDVMVDSYRPTELPEVFCAADFFVMLRADVPTNHFAYPNKFLEYAAARKPVIATPYVYDVAQQIEQAGVGILFRNDIDKLVEDMNGFDCAPEAFDAVVVQNAFQTTLVPFASDLNEAANSAR